jgi:hypothetical protein
LRLLARIGPGSAEARKVATAAQLQNRLWTFSELFYRNQGEENSGYVTEPLLRVLADSVSGLDAKRALADSNGPAVRALLAANDARAAGRAAGSFPTFFAGRTGARRVGLHRPARRAPQAALVGTAQQTGQQARRTRLHLLAQRQPARPPRARYAVRVRVAPARRVPLGQDQQVRAQRGQVPTAEGAAVGRGLAVRGRSDGVPAGASERVGRHPII